MRIQKAFMNLLGDSNGKLKKFLKACLLWMCVYGCNYLDLDSMTWPCLYYAGVQYFLLVIVYLSIAISEIMTADLYLLLSIHFISVL